VEKPLGGRARGATFVRQLWITIFALAVVTGSLSERLSVVEAHAIAVASEPADGARVVAPKALAIHFNARIEKSLCSVALVGPGKATVPLLATPSPRPETLAYTLPALAPGVYVATWKVLSADGHVTSGTVRFTVTLEAGK